MRVLVQNGSYPESFFAFFFRSALADLDRHHAQKFFKIDCAVLVVVHAAEHCFQIVFAGFKSKALHGNTELAHVNAAAAVRVEVVERRKHILALRWLGSEYRE